MAFIKRAIKLLAIGLVAFVLTIALFLVEMNTIGLLVGEFVISREGTVDVTLKAAIICIICTLILYLANKPSDMNAIQLAFYRNKFIIKSLGLFMLSSTGVLFHYQPVYDNPELGLLLRLDAYIVFFVYLPTAVIAYRKLWLCPQCRGRQVFGFNFFLGQVFSLRSEQEQQEKYRQFKQEAKSCQHCRVSLVP